MTKLRAMVIDDSAFNRRAITGILEELPDVEVVAKAGDGREALRVVMESQPDLITLDLEMPRMDGFTFLRLLMAKRPTPVIVVSGYANRDNVFRALELGALDFVAKPTRTVSTDLHQVRTELAEKVAVVRHLSRLASPPGSMPPRTVPAPPRPSLRSDQPKSVVVIGASTGGPTALVELFRDLPGQLDATVVVAQHMPPRFTDTFAQRLDRTTDFRVRQASGAHPLMRGEAWVCPGGHCIEIGADGQLVVMDPAPSDRYVPSIDRLFESAGRKLGATCLGIVLTGMGDDGAAGSKAIKAGGGTVFAESAETAVIYGMPQAAKAAGGVDELHAINRMAARIRAHVEAS